MNVFSIKSVLAGLVMIAMVAYAAVAPQGVMLPSDAKAEYEVASLDLTQDQQRANQLVQTLPIQDVLGSLAPIALSPFFALTCLSGASLLADAGLLPEGVMNNFMMSKSSPLHNESVFIGLLALTLLTAAPKLTKVSKPFAQAVDQLEAYSGIVAAIAVQFLSGMGAEQTASHEVAMVYHAGIFTASYSVLIMAFSAINIFVVNSVKFFFEIMIWISPIPLVDAVFEAANKAFTAFLITLYLFSPWAATFFNLLIFLISLAMFAWTYRRVVFMRCVLADPFFGWLGEAVFRMRRMTENSTRLPKSLAQIYPDATVVLKAFAGKKMKPIHKKSRGYLIQSGGEIRFVKPRWFGAARVVLLDTVGNHTELQTGLLSHAVVIRDADGKVVQKVLFTKRYNNALEQLRGLLKAEGSSVGEATGAPAFGTHFKSADSGELKSELA